MLKAIYDVVDDIPEPFRELYSERDGKFELTEVEGVRTQGDVDRLQGALTKERNDHKAVTRRLALLGDRKIEDVLGELDRIPELEAAAQGKMDDAKLEELVEARTKRIVGPIEREREQLKATVDELTGKVTGYEKKDRTRAIHDAVRTAATKAKVLPEAMEDALMLADRQFEVTEEGTVVTKDQVGVTPGIDSAVWLTEIQKLRPHWWGESRGGGAGGGKGGLGGSGKNPFSRDHWNLTEQGKILTEDRSKAEQLAQSAGTTVGGGMPPAKE